MRRDPPFRRRRSFRTAAAAVPAATWEYWRQLVTPSITGPNAIPRAARPAASPREERLNDLVRANRMLASLDLEILDGSGHVSMRDLQNPNRYYTSRYVSPGVVKLSDIIENDLDSQPVAAPRSDRYQERFLHGEIYRTRPDVMAVLHSHTPEFVAFSNSSVPLRPVINQGAFIGAGLPMLDIRKFDPRQGIISTPALGRTVADALGKAPGLLLKGHGIAPAGPSLRELVARAVNLRTNARVLQQAIALRGTVTYLESEACGACGDEDLDPGAGHSRSWELWRNTIEVFP